MYKKISLNQLIKASEEGNYTIDQTAKTISYSNGSVCSIYSKDSCLNESDKFQPMKKLQLNDTIMFAKYTPDGEFFITNDFNFKLSLFNVSKSYQLEHQFEPGILKTWKYAISPDSKTLATGAYSVFIYDFPNHSLLKEIDNHAKFIYSLIYLKDDYLAVGNSTGSINVFNINTGKYTHKIEEHCLTVRSMAYNEAGNRLFSASDDLHINIIDTTTYKVISPIVGHKDSISVLLYNETSRLLFSASYDGTVKLWDERVGSKGITTICEDKSNPIWDMSVSPKGETILFSGEEYAGAYQLT